MKKKSVEVRLADAADHEGLMVEDVATDPRLLRKHRIKKKDITVHVIHGAREYHRERMAEIIRRHEERNAKIERRERSRLGLVDSKEIGDTGTMTTKTKKNTAKKTTKKATTERTLVFDKYSPTAVMRWMGTKNWDYASAMAVFEKLGFEMSDSTVRIQVKAGGEGRRGDPAKLNREEQKKLNGLRKKVK